MTTRSTTFGSQLPSSSGKPALSHHAAEFTPPIVARTPSPYIPNVAPPFRRSCGSDGNNSSSSTSVLNHKAPMFTPTFAAVTLESQEEVACRLVCKLLYASSVHADDPLISIEGISLNALPDWAKTAVEQLPSGEFVQSAGFHVAIQKLHSADLTKVADQKCAHATVRFNPDGMNVNGFQTPTGLIVAADVPLLLPIAVYHSLGRQRSVGDFYRGYVDIPMGACVATCGLFDAMSSSDITSPPRGELCGEWCFGMKTIGSTPSCTLGINCPLIHADIDAVRRCCASIPCDSAHKANGDIKECPYQHMSVHLIHWEASQLRGVTLRLRCVSTRKRVPMGYDANPFTPC